jgi:hypothetical protein
VSAIQVDLMRAFSAIYRGERVIELLEDVDLPKDIELRVLILRQEDEAELKNQLRKMSEAVFAKLWDNKEDEVWNEYL